MKYIGYIYKENANSEVYVNAWRFLIEKVIALRLERKLDTGSISRYNRLRTNNL